MTVVLQLFSLCYTGREIREGESSYFCNVVEAKLLSSIVSVSSSFDEIIIIDSCIHTLPYSF